MGQFPINMEHYIQHTLFALLIGMGAAALVYAVDRLTEVGVPVKGAYVYAAVAWVGGVFYYLGREVRDWQKGTVGKIGFDYSGLFVPAVVCAFVFPVAAKIKIYFPPRLDNFPI